MGKCMQALALSAGAALLLTGLTQLPASATPLANSSAQALQLTLADQAVFSAPRTSKLDSEKGVAYEGSENPLPNMTPGLLRLGTLVQTADSFKVGDTGHGSDAHSQVTDLGLDVANIDGATMLAIPPAEELVQNAVDSLQLDNLSAAQLEEILGLPAGTLTALPVAQLDPYIRQVQDAVNGAAGQLTPALNDLMVQLDTNVELELGMAQANAETFRSITDKVETTGGASLTNARVVATIAGEELTILTLPSNSKPNTQFTQNLQGVTTAIRTEVLDDFAANLDEILQGQLAGPYAQLAAQLEDQVIAQVDEGLAPLFSALNESVIRGTLNKQVKDASGMEVSALELEILPGASNFGITSLADMEVARAAVASAQAQEPSVPENPETPDEPNTPVVDPPRDIPTTRGPDLPELVKSGK